MPCHAGGAQNQKTRHHAEVAPEERPQQMQHLGHADAGRKLGNDRRQYDQRTLGRNRGELGGRGTMSWNLKCRGAGSALGADPASLISTTMADPSSDVDGLTHYLRRFAPRREAVDVSLDFSSIPISDPKLESEKKSE
jgi:hypothetical protein